VNDLPVSGVFRAALVVIVALFVAGAATAQDVVIGGEVDLRTGLHGDLFARAAPATEASATLRPILSVLSDTTELRAQFSIGLSYPSEQITAKADEIQLTIYPSDTVVLHAGLLTATAGGALLFSPVNYLGGLDFAGLGALTPTLDAPQAALDATLFAGDLYVSLGLVPVPVKRSVLSALPSDVDLPFLFTVDEPAIPGSPRSRATTSVDDPQWLSDLARVSAVVESGWAGATSDVSLFLTYGVDRIPTLVGLVDTSAGAGLFDLRLRQDESTVFAAGASVQSVFGPVMTWVDASFALNRLIGTTTIGPAEVEPGVWSTEVVQAPELDLVAGAAVQLNDLWTTIACEYRHGFVFSDRTDLMRLDFPGTLLGSVEVGFLEGALNAGVTAVALIPDRSGFLSIDLNYAPSAEVEFGLQAPIVLAADGSLLSAFRSDSGASLYLAIRF